MKVNVMLGSLCPGLEPFCQEGAVLRRFEGLACGRILLAEILERDETPLVVLYDTSQDDDVNINAACLKALHDQALGNPLQVEPSLSSLSISLSLFFSLTPPLSLSLCLSLTLALSLTHALCHSPSLPLN